MTDHRIESKGNATIKAVRKLKEKKNRNESKLYLVEGFRLLEEAFKSGKRVEQVFYVPGKSEDFDRYIAPYLRTEEIYSVPEPILKELTSTIHPQGVVGVVSMDTVAGPKAEELEKNPLFLYLDGLQDPGNLGTIIRSAHAAGAGGILLGRNTVDPYSDKVIRSSMGSIFYVPLYQEAETELEKLLSSGYKLAVTSLDAERTIYEENLTQNLVLVIGNEGNGVSQELQEKAQVLLKIPMPGGAESLNAAVAASIILFEQVRQIGAGK